MGRGMDGFDRGGFAVGSVFGVRWWNLEVPSPGRAWGNSPTLRLKGAYDHWVPGENIAACKTPGVSTYWPVDAGQQRAAHEVPDDRCGCGFWAYWEQEKSPLGSSADKPVMGVVEGYGQVLIGEKGFRAEKARIVGLTCAFKIMVPDAHADPVMSNLDPSGMFRRGPQGMDAFRELGGGAPRWPMVEDLAALAELECSLGEVYGAPVYASAEFMLGKHPPTTDYKPAPPPPRTMEDVMTALGAGIITIAEALEELRKQEEETTKKLAALTARLQAAHGAGGGSQLSGVSIGFNGGAAGGGGGASSLTPAQARSLRDRVQRSLNRPIRLS